MTADLEQVLTEDEGAALDAAEQVITAGVKTFVKVGNALLTIRDDRLYRTTYKTFEDYCQQRWGLGRNYVNKVIVATEIAATIAAAVGTAVPIPVSERQARELAPLRSEPEVMQQAWSDAVAQSPNGQPTTADVREAVHRLNEISDGVASDSGGAQAKTGVSGGFPSRADEKPRPVRRRPLPDAMRTAVYELRKAAERLEKLAHDDRFPAYAGEFFTAYDADLATVAQFMGELSAHRQAVRR